LRALDEISYRYFMDPDKYSPITRYIMLADAYRCKAETHLNKASKLDDKINQLMKENMKEEKKGAAKIPIKIQTGAILIPWRRDPVYGRIQIALQHKDSGAPRLSLYMCFFGGKVKEDITGKKLIEEPDETVIREFREEARCGISIKPDLFKKAVVQYFTGGTKGAYAGLQFCFLLDCTDQHAALSNVNGNDANFDVQEGDALVWFDFETLMNNSKFKETEERYELNADTENLIIDIAPKTTETLAKQKIKGTPEKIIKDIRDNSVKIISHDFEVLQEIYNNSLFNMKPDDKPRVIGLEP
jgi:8-oxo-dGTP pyrophosphatase MutT (NUDIX family)